jgi:hypothetical protein
MSFHSMANELIFVHSTLMEVSVSSVKRCNITILVEQEDRCRQDLISSSVEREDFFLFDRLFEPMGELSFPTQ